MKKIIIIPSEGKEIKAGLATSLFEYLNKFYGEIILPLHCRRDFILIKNVYHPEHGFVTYEAR